ncbi:MAG: prolipoprotein diacylglyceryl transferase [Phycisphaera sp.]|nr:prolipoprotein diacylglyceryl transferase [Phycisphaera sp.]
MFGASTVPALLSEAILHTLDPFVFEISEGVGPRWYGTAYLAGFLLGWLIMRWLANTGRIPLNARQVGDLVTSAVIGVVVGGRLGHVVFYEPRLLTTFTGDFPFWGLLEIHKGGMSSHGGVIGVVTAIILFARSQRLPILAVGDAVCFVVPWGLGFGRIANWINGELWGRPLPEAAQANPPWWAVKYPVELEAFDPLPRALEPLRALAPATDRINDARFVDWIVATAYDRTHAAHAEVIRTIEPVLTAYYPSQFFQAAAEGVALIALMSLAWLSPRKAGVVSSIFLAGYGVLRYTTEQFREADSPVIALGFLTLPMLLSLVMVAAGVMIFALSRRSQPIGGLVWKAPSAQPSAR